MVFSLAACNGAAEFLGEKDIASLVAQYGAEPEMLLTLEYTTDEDVTVRLDITYKLLLEKLPITAINFINLVESGYYDEKVTAEGTTSLFFDKRINSNTNAWVVGNYTHTKPVDEDASDIYRVADDIGYTIIGEFYQNGWKYELTEEQIAELEADDKDPTLYDNNPDFSLFALAMYHDGAVEDFDEAGSAFFLTTSDSITENHKNYAVFAVMQSMTVSLVDGDKQIVSSDKAVADVLYDFSKLSDTTNRDVTYIDDDGSESKTATSMLEHLIRLVKVEMLGNTDFSNLPKDYIIK
jgi:cyclophilin family peptidyl-prolyl cis-trans isomerase